MKLRRRHHSFTLYGIRLLHVLIIVFTAVFIQEAASRKKFQEKNRVNILDLEKRIKLIMYKTMPRAVAARGIIFTTEVQRNTGRGLYFNINVFFVERQVAADDNSSASRLLPVKCMKRKCVGTDCNGFARPKF